MVTTKNEEVFGILDLVREEKADSLERLLAAINIITEEKVVCFRRKAAIFKKT